MNKPTILDEFKLAEVELVYRQKAKAAHRPKVTGPDDAYQIFMRKWDMNKIELLEQFYVMLLDRQNRCMAVAHLATGGYSDCNVDPKVIFALALKARANGLLLAHNHPSGETKPSFADLDVTRRIHEVGKALALPLLDHLVVTPNDYLSFADEALLPGR